MKERTRNLAVGITVIIAMLMVGGMILLFAGVPQMFQPGYEVRLLASGTFDVQVGDSVHLAGIRVGRIVSIQFTDKSDPARGVTMVAHIEQQYRIPRNVKAYIYTRGFMGGAYVEFKPTDDRSEGFLSMDEPAAIRLEHVGTGLLPPGLEDAVQGLAELTQNLNRFLSPPEQQPATTPADGEPATQPDGGRPVEPSIYVMVDKINRTLDSLDAVLGDQQNQQNIKQSLANLNEATEAATDAMESLKEFAVAAQKISTTAESRIDDLATSLIRDADRLSELMMTINRAATKLEAGEGTAGKLLNDPALYNNLVTATNQLGTVMQEFRALLEEWQRTGVRMRL